MLTLDEARERLLARLTPLEGETVGLAEAAGRVLVEPRVVAAVDVPAFANSAMDGYAVRAADTPGRLRLVGEVTAGMASPPSVAPGTAVRIMTGAPIPPGADAVVPVEVATEADDGVQVARARTGDHVRAAAHDTRTGDDVCLEGALTPARLAVLATLGIGTVEVRRRPVVAILSTGDELVEPGTALGPHQVHDANGIALAAAVREAGGDALLLPRVGDDAAAIERVLLDAAGRADLLVTSAGVSVGRHDHVRGVLEASGSLDFWRIAIQPGKPLAVGELGGTTLIGLPGNPVSALVVFELVVRPAIRRLLGLAGDGRVHLQAVAEERIGKDAPRRAFLRVRLTADLRARPAGGQSSSQLRPMAAANALLVVPEGPDAATAGESYEAILLEPLETAP
jgi:molybdopterin molybdotransferase